MTQQAETKGTNSWEASRKLGTPLVTAGTGNDMLGFVPRAGARVAAGFLSAAADTAQTIQAQLVLLVGVEGTGLLGLVGGEPSAVGAAGLG